MFSSILVIALGGSSGCLLRWFLGTELNSLFPTLPPGTLAANLIGGYLIGVAVAFFAGHPSLPPQWRLLVITGFLGGLTTFSTFSAETASLIQQGRWLWDCGEISVHVVGSLAMTLLGVATVALARQW